VQRAAGASWSRSAMSSSSSKVRLSRAPSTALPRRAEPPPPRARGGRRCRAGAGRARRRATASLRPRSAVRRRCGRASCGGRRGWPADPRRTHLGGRAACRVRLEPGAVRRRDRLPERAGADHQRRPRNGVDQWPCGLHRAGASLSLFLFLSLSVFLSRCLSVCLPLSLSDCLPLSLSVFLSRSLSLAPADSALLRGRRRCRGTKGTGSPQTPRWSPSSRSTRAVCPSTASCTRARTASAMASRRRPPPLRRARTREQPPCAYTRATAVRMRARMHGGS